MSLIWQAGNRNPSITENIVDDAGVAVDLTGATVRFKAREFNSSTLIVDQPATIVGAATLGNVRYDWSAADIATNGILNDAGRFLVWWEVTSGGKTQDVMEAVIEVRAHGPGVGVGSSYVELEEFKSTLSLTGDTFADLDAWNALVAASRAVDYRAGQRFWLDSADTTRYYTPSLKDELWIDPLSAITSFQSAPGGTTFDYTWVRDTDYALEPINAVADGQSFTSVRLLNAGNYAFPIYPNSVKIVGKFGWASPPPGVKAATTAIAARLFKTVREAPWGVVGFNDLGAIRISRDVPDIADMLSPYTIRVGLV